VSTLPFLAAFLDEPFDPSPYAPVSRLLWNELYVDPTRTPEWESSLDARKLAQSPQFTRDLDALRSSAHVDYRRLYARKREILKVLSDGVIKRPSTRRSELERFADSHPTLLDYARFRATVRYQQAPWPAWPSRLRNGNLRAGDYRQEDVRFHLYAQWLAHQQVHALSKKARGSGMGLYLDLPLGVHPFGYDVWRGREIFARDVNVGAPPDPIFTSGQDWGFHPLHPERSRKQGHRYWIACIRHHLASAGLLRIDHVMGLHRLFWIPKSFDFKDGVYVRYPVEELYGVLCLESHRNRSIIVGENLGIVPKYVNRAMSRHNIQQMYLMQYSLRPDPERPMRPIPSGSVASLNTHDTPLFASFWQETDIEDRQDLGLLDRKGARREKRARKARKKALLDYLEKRGVPRPNRTDRMEASTVLGACLARLRRSRAGIVLVNLEDLWLETEPQNVPGSGERRSNWTRKLRYRFEELSLKDRVKELLELVDSAS
jgi:4-alpha-glucanotransferase